MGRHINRKTTPKVAGGKPLRKNNHKVTPNFWNTEQEFVQIDEEKPGKGFKHFLKKKDIIKFLEIIPNWNMLSKHLDAIVLTYGGFGYDGYYNNNGVICISAWEKDRDILVNENYYHAHKELFERLGVESTKQSAGYFCEFTIDQIKAYQLLHILLHELGHHYDRIKTKSKYKAARGEDYAETFAFDNEKLIWKRYQEAFNVVLG